MFDLALKENSPVKMYLLHQRPFSPTNFSNSEAIATKLGELDSQGEKSPAAPRTSPRLPVTCGQSQRFYQTIARCRGDFCAEDLELQRCPNWNNEILKVLEIYRTGLPDEMTEPRPCPLVKHTTLYAGLVSLNTWFLSSFTAFIPFQLDDSLWLLLFFQSAAKALFRSSLGKTIVVS